jgi:hypothetical protein
LKIGRDSRGGRREREEMGRGRDPGGGDEMMEGVIEEGDSSHVT